VNVYPWIAVKLAVATYLFGPAGLVVAGLLVVVAMGVMGGRHSA
jgi:hypothetical protein